jgi:hypothetical protein
VNEVLLNIVDSIHKGITYLPKLFLEEFEGNFDGGHQEDDAETLVSEPHEIEN